MFTGRGRGRGRPAHNAFERSPPRRIRSPPQRESHYCSFCRVQLSSKRLFDEHKVSQVHKQKEILIEKALNDGLHFCYTCEKIFPSKIELDAHCLMSRHQPLYRVDEMQEFFKEKKKNEIKIVIKDIQKQPQSEQEIRRAKGEKERNNIVMELNKLRENESDKKDQPQQNKEQISYSKVVPDKKKEPTEQVNETAKVKNNHFCATCNIDCLNSSNYKVHIESWRHRAEVDKVKEEMQKKIEEEVERRFAETQKDDGIKTPSHLIEKKQYFCEVCSVPLSSENDYLDHLKLRRHLRQISQLRRPFKCYVCKIESNTEKDFNNHLQGRSHMNRAFKSRPNSRTNNDSKKKEEWVKKKDNNNSSRSKERSRDRHKDDSGDRSRHSDRREEKKNEKKIEKVENEKPAEKIPVHENRKVDIVKTPEGPIKDLREKIKGEKLIITKQNDLANREERTPNSLLIEKSPDLPLKEDRDSLDKKGKELEFEVKFKKILKEYENDTVGLQMRLAAEREIDITAYQRFEDVYNRLCREQDFIRDDLHLLNEGDPEKEKLIREMIRIQQEMREVRQELEMREMMIIKRENLFRDHFPDNPEKSPAVQIHESIPQQPAVIDFDHGEIDKKLPETDSELTSKNTEEKPEDDLRIQLERERLLKRLGPELDNIDPSIKEKLLAAIYDKETKKDNIEQKTEQSKPVQRNIISNPSNNEANEKETVNHDELKIVSEREKQTKEELAELKKVEKKKITTSLVPQYDDMDEKKDNGKKRSRGKSRSQSSDSHSSSSSNTSSSESDDLRSNKRKRRKSSPSSRSRNRSKSSTYRSKKRRHRSSSKEREGRKKKHKDDKKRLDRSKSDKKKSSKLSKKRESRKEKENTKSSTSVVDQIQNVIPVIGGDSISAIANQPLVSQAAQLQPQAPKRETSLFWKNPVAVAPPAEESIKEDVWDIAFSGGRVKEKENDETLNLFNQETPNQLSQEILNILRNVAPAISNAAHLAENSNERGKYPFPASNNISTSKAISLAPRKMERKNQDPSLQTVSRGLPPIFQSAVNVPLSKESNNQSNAMGGRVRSILKKNKEPLLEVTESLSVSVADTVSDIPGLETAATTAGMQDHLGVASLPKSSVGSTTANVLNNEASVNSQTKMYPYSSHQTQLRSYDHYNQYEKRPSKNEDHIIVGKRGNDHPLTSANVTNTLYTESKRHILGLEEHSKIPGLEGHSVVSSASQNLQYNRSNGDNIYLNDRQYNTDYDHQSDDRKISVTERTRDVFYQTPPNRTKVDDIDPRNNLKRNVKGGIAVPDSIVEMTQHAQTEVETKDSTYERYGNYYDSRSRREVPTSRNSLLERNFTPQRYEDDRRSPLDSRANDRREYIQRDSYPDDKRLIEDRLDGRSVNASSTKYISPNNIGSHLPNRIADDVRSPPVVPNRRPIDDHLRTDDSQRSSPLSKRYVDNRIRTSDDYYRRIPPPEEYHKYPDKKSAMQVHPTDRLNVKYREEEPYTEEQRRHFPPVSDGRDMIRDPYTPVGSSYTGQVRYNQRRDDMREGLARNPQRGPRLPTHQTAPPARRVDTYNNY